MRHRVGCKLPTRRTHMHTRRRLQLSDAAPGFNYILKRDYPGIRLRALISTHPSLAASFLSRCAIQMNSLSLEDKSPPGKQTCELQTPPARARIGVAYFYYIKEAFSPGAAASSVCSPHAAPPAAAHQIDSLPSFFLLLDIFVLSHK